MGSQQAAGLQVEDSMGSSWTEAAYEVVQDISAVLQSGKDDVQPLNDAPNYQVVCNAARQACSQAEHSICSSTAQHAISALHSKDLVCLCQLSTATLQLSSAICCDPAVALPLLSAGTHTPALDQLKTAVKSLTSMWTACMERLKQQQDMHGPAEDQTRAGSQHAWQCLIPSLAASLKCLLHMSITSAEFMHNEMHNEMCSMSALNLSWANLTRLLVAVPHGMRPQVLEAHDLVRGLQCALQQLQIAVAELPVHERKRQDTLVRFWLQSVSRLTSAVWEDAARQALQPLLQVTLEVFDVVVQQRQEFDAVQDILQVTLQPRLLACLSSLLSSSSDPATFQAKLDVLLQHPATAAHIQDQSQQQQQQRLVAQVYVVLAILQDYLPSWPQELVAVGCRQLLCWTLSTTGQELMTSVLGASAAAAAAVEGQGLGQQGEQVLEGEAAGLELIQGVLQGCLVGLMVCWGQLQDMQQQQMELLVVLNTFALSSHPVTSFLARQLLADLIAAASSSDLAEQQLGLLHKLLGASAAAAAMPGAAWEATTGADAVVEAIATVVQGCDAGFAAHWLKQYVMAGLGSSSSSSSSQWLDAGACALLAQESALLQRLVGAAPQLMPANQAQLQEAWTQLWSTAQQVAELLEPQHLKQLQQHTGSSSTGATQQQAETLLILHQLSWLLKAMQGVLQLCSMLDQAAATSLKQEAAELMLDILLKSVAEGASATQSNEPSTPAAAAAAAAAQYACTSAVLELLAVPGQLLLSAGQTQGLLTVLTGLAQQHEGLHGVLAGVLGSLGVTAKSGNQAYRELFQQLILSPHWPVKHAAYEALLQLLRHGDLANGILNLLPQALKISPTSAVPEVVTTVKAHLQKQPNPQAQASFAQQYPQLAGQHMQQLAAHAASRGSSTRAAQQSPPSSTLPDADALSNSVQELQGLLTACGVSAAAAAVAHGGGDVMGMGSPGARAQDATTGHAPMYADGVGGAQALLAQAAAAAKGLQAADKALSAAESGVQLLLTAASAAARDQALGAEGILLISKQGSSLMGNVASMISRLRALQDGLSTLRQ